MMPATSAVVVSIDRLGAGWLGPYGNTWLETPHFNRFAAQSLLLETVLADSPDLAQSCRAWWLGLHSMQAEQDVPSLPRRATSAGARSLLITDEPEVARHPLAAEFGELQFVEQPPSATNQSDEEETELFRFFSAAISALESCREPAFVWIHSRAMSGPWDAPLELRNQFADPDDPEPPKLIDPPNELLAPGFDPDQILGYVHAYAGQVGLADMCFGMLLEALSEHSLASETLLAVTSPRGYPLGEHKRVGTRDQALYGELLHVPLMIRLPRETYTLTRSQRLVQPHELSGLIADCCGWHDASEREENPLLADIGGARASVPRIACSASPGQRAIRTSAWFLREERGETTRHELFVKPDDRWEANEVSARCREEVELLAAELNCFEQAARLGQLSQSPPLA
jgi:Sulfatase